MATLILEANPLPTPVIGRAILAGGSRRGKDDHRTQNHVDKKDPDHSRTRSFWKTHLMLRMTAVWPVHHTGK